MSELEDYIHRQIPITAAMGVQVRMATVDRVELFAPLAPNINHRETVFGGSAAAIATLAAWTLVLVRMRAEGLTGRLVIASNSMEYQKPITADFHAVCEASDVSNWSGFVAGLNRKHRGRLDVTSRLLLLEDVVATFQGRFVAIGAPAHDSTSSASH